MRVEGSSRVYLGVNITPICNFDCPFCRPGLDVMHKGEGYGTTDRILEAEELLRIIRVAHSLGIEVFRVTGGEPTLREDLLHLLKGIRELGENVRINLDTNGTLLHRYLTSLKEIKNLHLRISLDRIDKGDGTPKYLTPALHQNIIEASKHFPVRINMVVIQSTKDQVWKIIEFCREHGLDLKLLDLNYDILDAAYWQREYYPLTGLASKLREIANEEVPYSVVEGGYGIPMTAFLVDNIRIIVRDSTAGSTFPPLCSRCLIFPCQEGFYNPIITCDGTLHPAGCLFKPLMRNLAYQSDDSIKAAFVRLLRLFTESRKSNVLFRPLREYLERGRPLETPVTSRYTVGAARRRFFLRG